MQCAANVHDFATATIFSPRIKKQLLSKNPTVDWRAVCIDNVFPKTDAEKNQHLILRMGSLPSGIHTTTKVFTVVPKITTAHMFGEFDFFSFTQLPSMWDE